MLQCVAVCCSVMQCVAVCCSVLQCVAVCCSASIPVRVIVRVCEGERETKVGRDTKLEGERER